MNPPVVIQMAVHNGAPWIRQVLDSVRTQTYSPIHVLFLDNASTDDTGRIVIREYPDVRYMRSEENLGFWTGQERLFTLDDAPFVLSLTDVVLDPGFLTEGMAAMQRDEDIGAVQGKIFQMTWHDEGFRKSSLIDALGFRITRSRRVIIDGHGEPDSSRFNELKDIFAVEGAVPLFRRRAIDACRVDGHFADPDYRVGSISYHDDVDMGWRMTLLGWRQVFVPGALGWHDRSTTKGVAKVPILGQLARRKQRAAIPIAKRRLDWVNGRFTLLKNDHIINILRDLPFILTRELAIQGYAVLFEPGVLPGWGRFFRYFPKMIGKRRHVMARAVRSAARMRQFISP